jgi:tripartite ATP-independent transporter DctP family solute receptor
MKKLLFFIFFIFSFVLSAIESETKIKIAVGTFPESVQYKIAEKCKEYIEKSSDMKVELFYGQHINNETMALKELEKNSVQIAIVSSGPCDDFAPEILILNYPFLFNDYNDIDQKLYGQLGYKILNSIEKSGFKGLAFSEEGFRHITNNVRPIHSTRDMNNLKIRCMVSLFHKEILESFNADAIMIDWPIYNHLANRVVDGEDNSLSSIFNSRLYEVQKYLTLTGHMFSTVLCLANLDWFNNLSGPNKAIILSGVKRAANWGKLFNREMERHMLKKLKNAGMIINENPDIDSFKREVINLKDSIFFSNPRLKKLLEEFLQNK